MLAALMIFGNLGVPLNYVGTQTVEAKTSKKKPSKGSKPKSSKSSKGKSSKSKGKGESSKSKGKSSKSKSDDSDTDDKDDSTDDNGDDDGTNSYTQGINEVLSRWAVWAGIAASKDKDSNGDFISALNNHPAAVWSVLYPFNVSKKGNSATLFDGNRGTFGTQYTISVSNIHSSAAKDGLSSKVKAVFNYYSALTDAHLLSTDINKNPLNTFGRWIIVALSSLTMLVNKMASAIFKIGVSMMAVVNPYVGIAYLTGNSHFLTKKYLGKGVVGKKKTYSGGQFWSGIFGTKKSGNESIVDIWKALIALVVLIYFLIFVVSLAKAIIGRGDPNESLGKSLGHSIWTYVQRILIVYLAPVILGVVGATVLGEVSAMAQKSMNDRASNFVYSNFIDVEDWAKNSRFGIPETADHNISGAIYANQYSNMTQKYSKAINLYEASAPGVDDPSDVLKALNGILIPYGLGKTFNASTVAVAPMQNTVTQGVNIKKLKWFSAKAAFDSDVISKSKSTDSLTKTLAAKPESAFNSTSLDANLNNVTKDSDDQKTGKYDTIFLADGSLNVTNSKKGKPYYYVGKAWHVKTKATPGTLANKAGLTSAGLINFLSVSSVSNGALTYDTNGNYADYASIAYTVGSGFTGVAKAITFCLSATFAGVVTFAVMGAIFSRLMAVTMDTLKNGVGILRGDLQAVVIMLKDMTVTCLQLLLGIILIIASSGVGGMIENIFDNATDKMLGAKWGHIENVIAPGPLASSWISAGGVMTFLKYAVEAVFYFWLIKVSLKSMRTFMDSINAMFDKAVDKMGMQHSNAFNYNDMPTTGLDKMANSLKDGLKEKHNRNKMLKNPTDDQAKKERDRLRNGGGDLLSTRHRGNKAADKLQKQKDKLKDKLKDKNLSDEDKAKIKQKMSDIDKEMANAKSIAKTADDEIKKRRANRANAVGSALKDGKQALSDGGWKHASGWKNAIQATKDLAHFAQAGKAKTVYDNNMKKLAAEQEKINAIKDPTARAEAQNRLNKQRDKLGELYRASGAMGMANDILRNAQKGGIKGKMARKRLQQEIEKARYNEKPTALTSALDFATDGKFSEAAKGKDMTHLNKKWDAQEFLKNTYGDKAVPSKKADAAKILKSMADKGAESAIVGDEAENIVKNEQELKKKQAKAQEILRNKNVLAKIQRDIEAGTVTSEEIELLNRAIKGTNLKTTKEVKNAQGNFENSKKQIQDENVKAFVDAAEHGDVATAAGIIQRVHREAKAAGLNEDQTNEIITSTLDKMTDAAKGGTASVKVGTDENGKPITMESGNFIKAASALSRVNSAQSFLTTDTAKSMAQEGSAANVAAGNLKDAGIAVTSMKDTGKKGDWVTGNQALSMIRNKGTRMVGENMAVPITQETIQQVSKISPKAQNYLTTISKNGKTGAPVEMTHDMVEHVAQLDANAGRVLERVYSEKRSNYEAQAQTITDDMIANAKKEVSPQAANFLTAMRDNGQKIVTTNEAVNRPADTQMLVKTIANKATAYTTGYAGDVTAETTVVDQLINDHGIINATKELKTQSGMMRQIHETQANNVVDGGQQFINNLEQSTRNQLRNISQARPDNIVLTASHTYDMSPTGMTIKQVHSFIDPEATRQQMMDVYQSSPGLARELRIQTRTMSDTDNGGVKAIVNNLEKGIAPASREEITTLQNFAQSIDASLSKTALNDYADALVESSKKVTLHDEVTNEAASAVKRKTDRKAMRRSAATDAKKLIATAVYESTGTTPHESHEHARARTERQYSGENDPVQTTSRSKGRRSA